jgi:hypothetical protein
MKQSTSKSRIISKAQAAQDVLPLPEHALPLLGMLAQSPVVH